MAKRGQGEGSISRRPNGTWWARVTVGKDENGKQKRQAFYGKTRKEVQEKLTEAVNGVNQGTYIEPSSMTVSEWLDRWMKDYKKPVLRPTTYRNYSDLFKWHIRPYIGDIKLKNLRNDAIQKAINEIGKKGVSPYTVRKAHEALYGALEQAVNNDLIVKNVASGTVFPPTEKKASRALTLDEQECIVALAKECTGGEAFLMSLATGMRIGEVLALTWDDIDWDEGVAYVRKTLSYIKDPDDPNDKWHNVIGPPKTKSSNRKIPLFPDVIELLQKVKLFQEVDKTKAVTALQNIRVAKGLTQTEVARKAGIRDGAYQAYEQGAKRPDMPTVERIAVVLGCDVSELLIAANTESGAVWSQGAFRYILRTEKRKYEKKGRDNRVTVTALKNKRALKGYAQKDFAAKVGLAIGAYRGYEEGLSRPEVPIMARIVDALGCKVADLVVPVKSKYLAAEAYGSLRYELRTEPIGYYTDNNLIFCTQTGKMHIAGVLRERFRELAEKAGINDIHIHCLRHTFATRGLESGVELRVMQDLLGHSSIKMTSDIYTHVLPEKKKDSVMKLTGVIKL